MEATKENPANKASQDAKNNNTAPQAESQVLAILASNGSAEEKAAAVLKLIGEQKRKARNNNNRKLRQKLKKEQEAGMFIAKQLATENHSLRQRMNDQPAPDKFTGVFKVRLDIDNATAWTTFTNYKQAKVFYDGLLNNSFFFTNEKTSIKIKLLGAEGETLLTNL